MKLRWAEEGAMDAQSVVVASFGRVQLMADSSGGILR